MIMTSTMTVVLPEGNDGRQARSQRTRTAVADALIECIKAGSLRPSAKEVAERAGVSARAVFRHFENMESLMEESTRIHLKRIMPLIPAVVMKGELQSRIRSIVNSWKTFVEPSAPMWRSGRIAMPFSAYLQRSDVVLHEIVKKHIEQTFRSELQQLQPAKRARRRHSLVAILSHAHWEELREKQKLSIQDAALTLEDAMLALLTA